MMPYPVALSGLGQEPLKQEGKGGEGRRLALRLTSPERPGGDGTKKWFRGFCLPPSRRASEALGLKTAFNGGCWQVN